MHDAVANHNMDALPPPEMTERAEQVGVAKMRITAALLFKNLFWVTLGNMIGGILVGIAYWFICLRNPDPKPSP